MKTSIPLSGVLEVRSRNGAAGVRRARAIVRTGHHDSRDRGATAIPLAQASQEIRAGRD